MCVGGGDKITHINVSNYKNFFSSGILCIVDPSQSYGVWEGWGTSLAWWAKVRGFEA